MKAHQKESVRQSISKMKMRLPAGFKIMLILLLIAFLPIGTSATQTVDGSFSGGGVEPVQDNILIRSVSQNGNDNYLPIISYEVPPNDWPMSGANPQRTSWTSAEVRGNLKATWYKHFDAYISQKVQIIAANNTIFISAADGLHALHPTTGNERWFYPTNMPLGNSPTYSKGVIYVGGYDRKIHAINASNGQPIWQYSGAGAGYATNPLVVDGLLFAGNRDGYMYAIYTEGANAGQLAWRFKTNGPILFSAAYKSGVIFFASNDMYAYALEASTGNQVWKSAKLPGTSYHSWWPVIYGNYVVFSGSYHYRTVAPYGIGSHNYLDKLAFASNARNGDPIGAYGTVAGNWVAGTQTINASRISQYFETYPYRRTTVLLDQSNGHEYTYDSDGDGRPEYPPFMFLGAKSGSRYPAAVGADNVLYQTNDYIYDEYIPRGHVTGWKFGTSTISRPTRETNAVDEPMGYAIGGSTVYWKRCCDRKAGAFSLDGTYNRVYYDEGTRLRRTLPELFDEGWDFSAWKHGDTTPPIPYNGYVYMINNNAVVAFSPNGRDPVLPLNENVGINTGVAASAVERATTLIGLNTKITFNSTSWPSLIQQERYYEISEEPPTRANYMRIFEVAGSSAASTSSTSVNASGNIITSTFSGGTLTTHLSRRTPSILFNNTGTQYRLFGDGSIAGIAYSTASGVQVQTGTASITGSTLNQGWLLVWDNTASERWMPVLISLQKRPGSISMTSAGLTLSSYSGQAGYLSVTPLYGMSAPESNEETSWPTNGIPSSTLTRINVLNQTSRSFPSTSTDTHTIDSASNDALITHTYSFTTFADEIGGVAPLNVAYIPPHTALAAWNGSPIRINDQPYDSCAGCLDFGYLTPIGRVGGVQNASSVTIRLPGLARYWRTDPVPLTTTNPNDPLTTRLVDEVQKIINAGHLLPGFGDHGIWDSKGGSTLGQYLADYWHNPSELYYTLVRALPLLPANLQTSLRTYLQNEFQDYPAHSVAHIGWEWSAGTQRDAFTMPPEILADNNFTTNTTGNSWGFPQENLYASWLYAEEFGNMSAIFTSAAPKLNTSWQFKQSTSFAMNSQIAGYIGYLQMARQVSAADQSANEKRLIDLLILRAALTKYPFALEESGFEYAGTKWSVRTYAPNMPDTLFVIRTQGTLWSQMPLYGFPIDVKYGLSGGGTGGGYSFGIDFVNLVPELADFMNQYARDEVNQTVIDHQQRTPYWFVADSEEGAGESVLSPIYDVVAMFQAKALILKQPRSQLEPYLDVSSVPIGDLYYIQNLISTISAGN